MIMSLLLCRVIVMTLIGETMHSLSCRLLRTPPHLQIYTYSLLLRNIATSQCIQESQEQTVRQSRKHKNPRLLIAACQCNLIKALTLKMCNSLENTLKSKQNRELCPPHPVSCLNYYIP